MNGSFIINCIQLVFFKLELGFNVSWYTLHTYHNIITWKMIVHVELLYNNPLLVFPLTMPPSAMKRWFYKWGGLPQEKQLSSILLTHCIWNLALLGGGFWFRVALQEGDYCIIILHEQSFFMWLYCDMCVKCTMTH
jgi:hypothetical protein